MAATTRERLDALEAELAELRQLVTIREDLLGVAEHLGYARGRESIFGRQAGTRPPCARHLHALDGGSRP
jgi:hypothetical protein